MHWLHETMNSVALSSIYRIFLYTENDIRGSTKSGQSHLQHTQIKTPPLFNQHDIRGDCVVSNSNLSPTCTTHHMTGSSVANVLSPSSYTLTHSRTFPLPGDFSFYQHPHSFPMLFLLSEHVFLHGRAYAAYRGQDSCLPCIMCPLRAPLEGGDPSEPWAYAEGPTTTGKSEHIWCWIEMCRGFLWMCHPHAEFD